MVLLSRISFCLFFLEGLLNIINNARDELLKQPMDERYILIQCKQKDAFPKGKIGELMQNVLEIKTNNLGFILQEIKSWK